MIIIKEQDKVVSKIWGKQKIEDAEYRLIRYSLLQKVDDGILLYNLVTGELILFEGIEELNIHQLTKEEYLQLIEKHFLVTKDYNELSSVRQLRKIAHRISNIGEGITSYTIMPTSYCNARCFYCFEADFPYIHMSEETAEKLVDYMVKKCNEKKFLNLTWYGGEPTVGAARIDQICEGLTKHNIGYSSFMYSNGYLFDDTMVQKAITLWKLNKIQITLDGTEDVYNRIKAFKVSNPSPYLTVLGNIVKLLDAGIFVLIRLNMDYHNFHDLKTLITELADLLKNRSNVSVYVNVLFDNEGFQKTEHSEEDKVDLHLKRIELEKLICENHLSNVGKPTLKCLNSISCCADNDHHYLINPQGNIAKCDHSPYTNVIGDINNDVIDYKKYEEIAKPKEFYNCSDCTLFPTCNFLSVCDVANSCNEIQISEKRNYLLRGMLIQYSNFRNNKVR